MKSSKESNSQQYTQSQLLSLKSKGRGKDEDLAVDHLDLQPYELNKKRGRVENVRVMTNDNHPNTMNNSNSIKKQKISIVDCSLAVL